jgi:hypothetical protein
VHFYAAQGQRREERAVGVAVVAEAVDEDEAGSGGDFGLWDKRAVLAAAHFDIERLRGWK